MSSRGKLRVGDEVFDKEEPSNRAVATRYKGGDLYVMFCAGSSGKEPAKQFQKTGRRFELKKILKKLK